MNNLSWLLYGADAANKIIALLVVGSIIWLIGILVITVAGLVMESDGDMPVGSWRKPFGRLWIPVACLLLAALIPSQRTIYMIAASQFGEQIITSPGAVEMMNDLKTIIQKRLKDELDGGSK